MKHLFILLFTACTLLTYAQVPEGYPANYAKAPRFKALIYYTQHAEEAHVQFAEQATTFFKKLNYGDGFVDFLKRTGTTVPLLLLDDIFDKLDASRVEQIIKLVAGDSFGQIFITDTNREHLDRILHKVGSDYKMFRVEQGTVAEMKEEEA